MLLPADVEAPPELARKAAGGIYFQDLEVDWPTGKPNDLESIARIPGTAQLLLVESGDDCSGFQRIFLASLHSPRLTIDEVVPWPDSGQAECAGVFNVESSAVFALDDQLFFVYAERAEGLTETQIRWATLQLDPLRFGTFRSARYRARVEGPGVRPIVALDVDDDGQVYGATAFDPGEDDGPFRSFVSRIGQFRRAPGGTARFVPSGRFADVARQDGYKIEGVAVRPRLDGTIEIFAGTDDENYGATLRRGSRPFPEHGATAARLNRKPVVQSANDTEMVSESRTILTMLGQTPPEGVLRDFSRLRRPVTRPLLEAARDALRATPASTRTSGAVPSRAFSSRPASTTSAAWRVPLSSSAR